MRINIVDKCLIDTSYIIYQIDICIYFFIVSNPVFVVTTNRFPIFFLEALEHIVIV